MMTSKTTATPLRAVQAFGAVARAGSVVGASREAGRPLAAFRRWLATETAVSVPCKS